MKKQRPKTLQDLFDRKSKWCQGSIAKDKSGTTVFPRSKSAIRWCLMGGIEYITGAKGTDKDKEIYRKLRAAIELHFPHLKIIDNKWVLISAFNDNPNRSFKDIKTIIKEADV